MKAVQKGFTLIELMITVAIISILAAIAIPLYNEYIDTSREGVLVNNISTIVLFQEEFRLRTGAYANGLADIAAITGAIDWAPVDDNDITYAIAASDGTLYQVTATDATGLAICIEYPSGDRC